MPGPESLFEPGKREGQTKLVRQGDSVSCYSWSASEGQWNKVGDVLGAAGTSDSNKTTYEGKEYDFVFSIDIAEGQPPLKLPYNVNDDAWMTAQEFIYKHDLSQYHLETVANFIIKNSKSGVPSAAMDSSRNSSYTDPLTGGSRYVPSSGAVSETNQRAASGDPFTGSGRYVPPSSNVNVSSKYSAYFPVKQFLRFEQANVEAIGSKLTSLIRSKIFRFTLPLFNWPSN